MAKNTSRTKVAEKWTDTVALCIKTVHTIQTQVFWSILFALCEEQTENRLPVKPIIGILANTTVHNIVH